MAKEDTVKWLIKGEREATARVEGGVWDIESVTGTERAKHRVKYYKRKYKVKDKVKIFRVKVGG